MTWIKCEYCNDKKCDVICHRVGSKEWCGERCCKCIFRGLAVPVEMEVRE